MVHWTFANAFLFFFLVLFKIIIKRIKTGDWDGCGPSKIKYKMKKMGIEKASDFLWNNRFFLEYKVLAHEYKKKPMRSSGHWMPSF